MWLAHSTVAPQSADCEAPPFQGSPERRLSRILTVLVLRVENPLGSRLREDPATRDPLRSRPDVAAAL
jgi:hypothetical protein